MSAPTSSNRRHAWCLFYSTLRQQHAACRNKKDNRPAKWGIFFWALTAWAAAYVSSLGGSIALPCIFHLFTEYCRRDRIGQIMLRLCSCCGDACVFISVCDTLTGTLSHHILALSLFFVSIHVTILYLSNIWLAQCSKYCTSWGNFSRRDTDSFNRARSGRGAKKKGKDRLPVVNNCSLLSTFVVQDTLGRFGVRPVAFVQFSPRRIWCVQRLTIK